MQLWNEIPPAPFSNGEKNNGVIATPPLTKGVGGILKATSMEAIKFFLCRGADADHNRLLPGLPGYLLPGGGSIILGPGAYQRQSRSSLHGRILLRQDEVLASPPEQPASITAPLLRDGAGWRRDRLGGGAGVSAPPGSKSCAPNRCRSCTGQQRQHGLDGPGPPALFQSLGCKPSRRQPLRRGRGRRPARPISAAWNTMRPAISSRPG